MSAVCRNVSRKSVQSSGISPKRTRAAGRLLRAEPFAIGLNPRQRHARLDAPLHLDERELHVDGDCQLGLRSLELLELDDFARFGARSADGGGGRWQWLLGLLWLIGHVDGIVGQDRRQRGRQPAAVPSNKRYG